MSTRGNLYHVSNHIPTGGQRKLQKRPPARNFKRNDTGARKSRVYDKIKQWVLMRCAGISFPQSTENIPALPITPTGLKSPHVRSESLRIKREKLKEEIRVAENRLLDGLDLDPDVREYGRVSLNCEP